MDYDILPIYKRPFKSDAVEATFDYTYLKRLHEAYDDKDFIEATICALKYINDTACIENDFLQSLTLSVNQEKCRLDINIKDETFFLEASLVEITPKTNKTALYRRVAEFNHSRLLTQQIKLENGKLKIRYSCKLSLMTPRKFINIICSTAVNGAYFVNLFNELYGTKTFDETKIKLLDDEKTAQAKEQVKDILDQSNNYAEIFKNSRYSAFGWENAFFALLKIGSLSYINGYIQNEINEYINMMYDENRELSTRIEQANSFLHKLSKKDMTPYIYEVENFVPIKSNFSVHEIQDRLKYDEENIKKYMNNKDYLFASYLMQTNFLKLDFYYNLTDTYKDFIYSALEDISSKKLEYGAQRLYKLYEKMLESKLLSNEDVRQEELFKSRYNISSEENKEKNEAESEPEVEPPKTKKTSFLKTFFKVIALIVGSTLVGFGLVTLLAIFS